MLKLKLQYFGHVMRRGNSLEKTLMLYPTLCNPMDCIRYGININPMDLLFFSPLLLLLLLNHFSRV